MQRDGVPAVPYRLQLWSLREDVLIETTPVVDQLVALTRWGEIWIEGANAFIRESLRRMSLGPVDLINAVPRDNSWDEAQRCGQWLELDRVLDQLAGCVINSLRLDDSNGPLLSVVPLSRRATLWLQPVDRGTPVRLSRFASMRTRDGELVLESPLARHRVVLHKPVAARIAGALGSPTTIEDLAPIVEMSEVDLAAVVCYLASAGVVVAGERSARGGPPGFVEDTTADLVPWSRHELEFHAMSRLGRQDELPDLVPQFDPGPAVAAVRPAPTGPVHRLPRPDEARAGDPVSDLFAGIRRRPPDTGEKIDADTLGELLYRATRLGRVADAAGGRGQGEGLHELDLYLTLHDCAGLPRGIHRYDEQAHALTQLNSTEADVAELLDNARVGVGAGQRPPVLISMVARVSLLSWRYSGVAYATVLRHVGMVQQMLHLVATAMGLDSCASPIGDTDTATRAFRLDWPAEVSVGEFTLGGRRREPGKMHNENERLRPNDRIT